MGKGRAKGAGCIVKIKGRFYLRTGIGGVRKHTVLRDDDGNPVTRREEAEAAAKKLSPILIADQREELALHVARARKLRKQSSMLLADAWETYLRQPNRPDSAASTLRNHSGILRLFLRWLSREHPQAIKVCDVTSDIAESYFSYVWSSGVSAKRYNDQILSLRLIFRHLAKPAGLDENPFAAIVKKQPETVHRREFTESQIISIFGGFRDGFFYETVMESPAAGGGRQRKTARLEFRPMHPQEMRVLLNLCCWTGCDGQTGCLMTWDNVDLDGNRIAYLRGKTRKRTGGKIITLPLHPDLRAALLDAKAWESDNQGRERYILPSVAARYRRNPSGIQKDVMNIIRCATGLETSTESVPGRRKLAANLYSLHSFRHSFVSFCINAGVPLAVIEDIVGDGSPTLKKYYSHVSEAARREAMAALPVLSDPGQAAPDLAAMIEGMDKEKKKKLLEIIKQL